MIMRSSRKANAQLLTDTIDVMMESLKVQTTACWRIDKAVRHEAAEQAPPQGRGLLLLPPRPSAFISVEPAGAATQQRRAGAPQARLAGAPFSGFSGFTGSMPLVRRRRRRRDRLPAICEMVRDRCPQPLQLIIARARHMPQKMRRPGPDQRRIHLENLDRQKLRQIFRGFARQEAVAVAFDDKEGNRKKIRRVDPGSAMRHVAPDDNIDVVISDPLRQRRARSGIGRQVLRANPFRPSCFAGRLFAERVSFPDNADMFRIEKLHGPNVGRKLIVGRIAEAQVDLAAPKLLIGIAHRRPDLDHEVRREPMNFLHHGKQQRHGCVVHHLYDEAP